MLRLSLIPIAAVVLAAPQAAHADAKDRAAIADTATKLSSSAANLAKTAKASDDRGARKKFAPAASDLGDDLAALSRRAGKDIALKTLAKDAADIDKDATALVDLADEAEDKDERKALRAQAVLIEQGVAGMRKTIDEAAAKEDSSKAQPAQGTKKFTGRLFNNTDKCSWDENLKFVISRNGQQVFATQMIFPGKNQALVLDEGSYLVQILETNGDFLGQKTLDVKTEGWQFVSGCVKDN